MAVPGNSKTTLFGHQITSRLGLGSLKQEKQGKIIPILFLEVLCNSWGKGVLPQSFTELKRHPSEYRETTLAETQEDPMSI